MSNRIKERREARKLTQRQLAERMGVSLRTIQRWERDESVIRMEDAFDLSDLLDSSVNALFMRGEDGDVRELHT